MQLDYFLMGFVILLLAGTGLGMAIYVVIEWKRDALFRKEGKIAQGVITGSHTENRRIQTQAGFYEQTVYYVAFSYEVDGKTYAQDTLVNEKEYDANVKGMPVSVRYAATRPEIARLVDDTTHKFVIPVLISSSALCFLGIPFIVIGLMAHPL